MNIPIKIPVVMPLVKNDEKLLQIEDLIESKRRMLLEKQKKIRFIAKQNRFLDAVKNDYVKYYTYIAQQKQDQIKALQLLDNYIHDLSRSGQLSKHNIEDAKVEQNKILKEVKSIKEGLESIMENTQHIDAQI
jgi:predicted MPP superfamily phosphohydrolase